MPKYYRFRAVTPTRKAKGKDKERDLEKLDPESSRLDSMCNTFTPCEFWYMRRTSWRQNPPLSVIKQLCSCLRTSLQLSDRQFFALKSLANKALKIKS